VIVLLNLCYEVIVAYIQKKTGFQEREIISFILDIGSWLWLIFVKYQLNSWLKKQGGWVRIGKGLLKLLARVVTQYFRTDILCQQELL